MGIAVDQMSRGGRRSTGGLIDRPPLKTGGWAGHSFARSLALDATRRYAALRGIPPKSHRRKGDHATRQPSAGTQVTWSGIIF